MDKEDTIGSLVSRVQKRAGSRVRSITYKDEETNGKLTNKDKLITLKSGELLSVKFWSNNNDNLVKLV